MADLTNRLRVVGLERTCESCPSQWEGTTDDGRHFYARYRWSELSFGVGDTLTDAVRSQMVVPTVVLDAYDGTMGTEEMKKHLTPYVEFRLERADG